MQGRKGTSRTAAESADTPAGLLLALAAYLLWSANPLYFRLLEGVSPLEVTAHRAFWSLPTTALLLLAGGGMGRALAVAGDGAVRNRLVLSALFIGLNWGVFVWGVEAGRTLEVSLGYFINPLMNVAVGFVLLGERFSRLQVVAIALAVLAVLWLVVSAGVFPWLALVLAVSFTAYSYLRKRIAVGPVDGLFVESAVLSVVFAVVLGGWLWQGGRAAFAHDGWHTWLLALTGPVTVAPLVLFAGAARRIRLSTLGLMQYIAPTGMFLTAVFIFGEPLDMKLLTAFVLIWIALVIYAIDTLRRR